MIATYVAWRAKERLWRLGVSAVRVSLVLCLVMLWGCVSAQQTILLEEVQPGGRARLRSPDTIVLGGGGTDLGGKPLPGSPGFIGPVLGSTILPSPPAAQWAAMVGAAAAAPCLFPDPRLLAAIAYYESAYGTNPGPSSAGAIGYGQFMPATLAEYNVPITQANNYQVVLPAMVRKLCHDGIAVSIDRALLAYNNSLAYVEHIKALAASWATTIAHTWQDIPAFNQFDPGNWAQRENYTTWAAAACSAASLDWLLSAYGQPPGSIDAALALIGPNSGINARVGLLDASLGAVARAMTRAGLPSWQAHLTQAGLIEKLQNGPAILDGAAWFGVGHVFVATAADQNGVSVRESSGNNIQYVTWAQLYSVVGWNGWAVGVGPTPTNNAQA